LPSVPHELGALTEHSPRGSTVPAGTFWQTPRNPGTLQARQRPQDELPQHTPSTQFPLPHSAPAAQVAPLAFFWQALPTQAFGATQLASVVQLVGHAPLLQRYAPQAVPPEALAHLPLPSQVEAPTARLSGVQVPGAQTVPAGCSRHAPLPSQVPSVPHVEAAVAAHWPAGAGAPAGKGRQVPRAPVTLQAWQVPQLALPQQTPSTQAPLPHSAAAPHGCPNAFSDPQRPFSQRVPGAQSACVLHVLRQRSVAGSQA
jgi:hypothetical protein